MDQGATFTTGGNVYNLRFTAAARYLFNERVGKPVTHSKWVAGVPDDRELLELLLAGLEGARLKAGGKGKAWTLSRVFDLVDGMEAETDKDTAEKELVRAVGVALAAVFPKAEENEQTEDEAEEADEGKPAARGGSES